MTHSYNDAGNDLLSITVKCARGQYSPGYSQPCRLCELGEYQDDVGEDECEFCPYGYTTIYRGSTSSSDCIPICYEGQFYDVDRLQCRPCETGFYQDEPGQACCKPCRVHMITTGVGANSSYDCIGEYITHSSSWVTRQAEKIIQNKFSRKDFPRICPPPSPGFFCEKKKKNPH